MICPLQRFRLRNKKSGSVVRQFPLANKGIKDTEENMGPTTEVGSSLTNPLLISRGSGGVEELKRVVTNGTNGTNGPTRTPSGSTELYESYFIGYFLLAFDV